MEVIQVLPLCASSAKQIHGSILHAFPWKIILHCLLFLEGIMPWNFQKRKLVRIVRLSAECYSQWGVARMSWSKDLSAKLCYATETLVGYIIRGLEVGGVWEDKQLIRMVIDNRYTPAVILRMEVHRFLRGLSVSSMVKDSGCRLSV